MINVYLDLDGVIFDFDTVFKDLFGEWESPDKEVRFTKAIFDHKIFVDLPLLPKARDLINILLDETERGKIDVQILSSTGSPHSVEQSREVVRQKREALARHRIWFDDNYTVHKGIKRKFATPNSLLIDDHPTNVKEFIEDGGYGYLYDDKNPACHSDIVDMINKIHRARFDNHRIYG